VVPQLFLTHGTRCVNLVTEDEERDFGQLLNGEESIELGFGFGETLKVSAIDEEHNAIDFREVVTPETAGWKR